MTSANELFDREIGDLNARNVLVKISAKSDKARKIVKEWAKYSAVGAVVPAPIIDAGVIAFCQIKMVEKICSVYNIRIRNQVVTTIVTALLGGGMTTYLISATGKSLLKSLPFVGVAISILGEPSAAYCTTVAIGHAFIEHFEATGSLSGADKDIILIYFKKHLEKFKINA